MKNAVALAALLALSLTNAAGQGKTLTNDPLTGLPVIPATVQFKNVGNEPDKMPDTQVCKSKVQGNVYSNVMNPANGSKWRPRRHGMHGIFPGIRRSRAMHLAARKLPSTTPIKPLWLS
jgi:hypothetical protein